MRSKIKCKIFKEINFYFIFFRCLLKSIWICKEIGNLVEFWLCKLLRKIVFIFESFF